MTFPAVMKYRSNRMVLRQPRARDQVELAAGQAGWTLVGDSDLTWKVGPGTQLQYAEDDMSPNCCVAVASASSKLAAEKAQEAFDLLDPWTLDELVHLVEASTDPIGYGQAILRVALAAPYTFEYTVFDVIHRGLLDPDERVRDMSLWATTYSPWQEYERLLREIRTTDPVVVLRERAGMVLEAFDAASIRR